MLSFLQSRWDIIALLCVVGLLGFALTIVGISIIIRWRNGNGKGNGKSG